MTKIDHCCVQMDGESAGLNQHTKAVNRGPGDGLLASSTVMPKKIKVMCHIFAVMLFNAINAHNASNTRKPHERSCRRRQCHLVHCWHCFELQ